MVDDHAQRRVTQLEQELNQRTEDLIRALETELTALRRRRDSLNHAISALSRKRARYLGGRDGRLGLASARPAKTVAAVMVLSEVAPEPMRLRDLHAELVARGWSNDAPRDRHALEVAVRSLEQCGKVRRPRRGWYVAAESAEELAAVA